MDGYVKTAIERVNEDARNRHACQFFFKFFNKLTVEKGVQFHVRLVQWRAIHLHKELSLTRNDTTVTSSWAVVEEHLPNFQRFSKNDASTKLLASAYGSEILEAMQCASTYVFDCALIADLEGEMRNNTCILTDLIWVTSEDVNLFARKRVDFGNAALAKFTMSHIHNKYCRQFGLESKDQHLQARFQEGQFRSSTDETRTRMESLLN
jgi:hypothetical protein